MLQSLEQVESFFVSRKALGINPGLNRMHRLLESQSNPQLKFKAIHIAGTNGKGSTLTYMKAALLENNYRIGVFTSPSLTGYIGHMFINEQPIGEEHFLRLFNQLLPTINILDSEEMYPTEFEIITTIAFMYFAENVDIAIVETGMGGREDTTNLVQPILSIITNIAMDHASFLGDTLEKIAFHKAGIIKENVPTILGNIDSISLPIIIKEATKKNSQIYRLNEDFSYEEIDRTACDQTFQWIYKELNYRVEIQMLGTHQIDNASTVLMALFILQDQGFLLNYEKILKAFRSARLAGRFEKVQDNPEIVLDGAHNPDGMKAFLDTVHKLYQNKKKHLIFAGFRDKDLANMLEIALPYFDTISVTTFDHPRAEKAEGIIENVPSDSVGIVNWKERIIDIQKQEKQDEIYFFAGSLSFIGFVRDFLMKQMM